MTIIISSVRFLVIDFDLLLLTIRSMINSIIYINKNHYWNSFSAECRMMFYFMTFYYTRYPTPTPKNYKIKSKSDIITTREKLD